MATLASFDPRARGREARIRALLDDLVQAHIQGRLNVKVALAVWYRKFPGSSDQYLLELVSGPLVEGFFSDHLSLLWKSGAEGQPYANIKVASVDYFSKLKAGHPGELAEFYDGEFEVLYFDKHFLSKELLDSFRIVTDPQGLMKGWYVTEEEYKRSSSAQALLSRRGGSNPELGLVKTWESDDFEHCRGILHVEVSGKWLPLSPEALRAYTYYVDTQNNRHAYLVFEGGATYEILKFEVKTVPDYSSKFGLLEKAPDDRYPEVYLRTVRPLAQPAA
jgi:hypothetical protein